jgi:hypothetical protein
MVTVPAHVPLAIHPCGFEGPTNVPGFSSRAAGGAHGHHGSSQRMSRCQRPRLCRSRSLSSGSFTAENIGPQPERQDGHKVWIASQRKGHNDATLRITGPDGQAHLERRKSGVSWAAGVAQFYPGNLSVTKSGIYRLRIRVGRDTMCVRVYDA